MVQLIQGDCLAEMAKLPSASVHLILCDLPYGTTACRWDSIIPFGPLWQHYRRLLRGNGAVVLTASQPFTSALVTSNPDQFKYEIVWVKSRATGHVHAKNKPMKRHENVLVFSPGTTVHATQSDARMTYTPQGLVRKLVPTIRKNGGSADTVMGARPSHRDVIQEFENYPDSILEIPSEGKPVHPTQKPIALMEYLIRTYTLPGQVVLDNCMGSGTTGVAAVKTYRKFVGIELDGGYYEIARRRIAEAEDQLAARAEAAARN